MPVVEFEGLPITCNQGENLRRVLLQNNLSPYNGIMKHLNCRGIGSCGTCAVHIEGEVNPITFMERWRLRFPPHKEGSDLRLACQVKVENDIKVSKGDGLWGQYLGNTKY